MLLGAERRTPNHDVVRDNGIAVTIALHRSGLSSHSSLLLRRHVGSMIPSSSLSSVIPSSSSSSLARLVVVGTHGGLVGLGGRSACRTPWRRWFGLGTGDSNANNNSSSNHSGGNDGAPTSFLRRFLAPKVMPPRNTPRWYAEMALLCVVFGITGTSTMFFVRPAVSDVLGLEGSMKDGESSGKGERDAGPP